MADFFARKRVWVAGETGLVGRALVRTLQKQDATLLSAPRAELDLTDQASTFAWLKDHKPDFIFMAAARVGGIGSNSAFPGDFIRDNLSIAQNVIDGAHRAGVQNLLFLGSSCIYPRDAAQPITEDALMTGPLEQTNEAYAIAKIAGLKMCRFYQAQFGRRYISAMPTNLYGPYDRFDETASHVIPAMLMKFHAARMSQAPEVVLWGSGTPLREFLHVDDLASALVTMMERYDGSAPLNIGSGKEVSISALAGIVRAVTGYAGKAVFDPSRPDGTPRKLLDSSRILALGWKPVVELEDGLQETYAWFTGCAAVRQSA